MSLIGRINPPALSSFRIARLFDDDDGFPYDEV